MEKLAKDEIEFAQDILPRGISLPKDYKSPLSVELSTAFDSIQAVLEHNEANCVMWPVLRKYGCKVMGTTGYYPRSWYSLREMGIPSENRTDIIYWVPICKVCALIPRPRRKTAWAKAAGKQMKVSMQTLAMQHKSVFDLFHTTIRKYAGFIDDVLVEETKRVYRYKLFPGMHVPSMGRIIHIDATGLRDDGAVVIVCYT